MRRALFRECVATGQHAAAAQALEPVVTLDSTDAELHAGLAQELFGAAPHQ